MASLGVTYFRFGFVLGLGFGGVDGSMDVCSGVASGA